MPFFPNEGEVKFISKKATTIAIVNQKWHRQDHNLWKSGHRASNGGQESSVGRRWPAGVTYHQHGLPAISLLCTPYALREKKNQRIFVHIEYSASPTTFLGRKYGIQVADFQDEAIWGVIWLADKWATGPWDVIHMGFRCIASRFKIKYDIT